MDIDCVELMCMEAEEERRAFPDPVLLKDERVMERLLKSEDRYLPSHPPFQFQKDVKPYMLKIVLSWMLEVSEEQKCEDDVFPLASNYMCRVLAVMQVPRRQLQLVGAVCLFIASKLKETTPLSAEKLVMYTDYSVQLAEITEMEMVVLFRLKWDLSAITPNDFLDQILDRLKPGDLKRIKRYAQTYIALCSTEFKFASMPPSLVSSASLATALRAIETEWSAEAVFARLQSITGIEADCLRHHQEQIEAEVVQFLTFNSSDKSSPPPKSDEGPTTPTDIRDIVY
ncbi:DgyrCDS4297 [Dimorphilus gyrociliatus]|uniref:DgyrCDS4297 n=1 Tax=Dimorphilus gyrociliatus TaxID=2664684 RepID=A0A7I8VH45_9ANNE|nr:DgyrCDS4297 [Dimorphilus gyrociliatus]